MGDVEQVRDVSSRKMKEVRGKRKDEKGEEGRPTHIMSTRSLRNAFPSGDLHVKGPTGLSEPLTSYGDTPCSYPSLPFQPSTSFTNILVTATQPAETSRKYVPTVNPQPSSSVGQGTERRPISSPSREHMSPAVQSSERRLCFCLILSIPRSKKRGGLKRDPST